MKKKWAVIGFLCVLFTSPAVAQAVERDWWLLGYRPEIATPGGTIDLGWSTSEPSRISFRFIGYYTVRANPRSEHVRIWLPLPADDAYQSIHLFRVDPAPVQVIQSRYGYRIAVFDFGRLRKGMVARLQFNVEATLGRYPGMIDPARVGTLEEIPEQIKADYLADRPMYNISDPTIVAAAREAVGSETNPVLMMGRIATWVRQRLKFQGNNHKQPAPEVLRLGNGTCTEYSFVMIAMARSLGLPARFLAGMPVNLLVANAGRNHNAFHKIVEVYLPRIGWTPVESSAGRKYHVDRTPEQLVGWAPRRMLVMVHEPEPDLAPIDPRYNITTFVPFQLDSRLNIKRDETMYWRLVD